LEIILDVGSGNSIRNNIDVRLIVDAIKEIDTGKHDIVIKAQLFENQPPNTPLPRFIFEDLYQYSKRKGYKCTASVFDMESLKYLLQFDVPFIKIACRPELYWLIGEVPRKIPVYVSSTNVCPEMHNDFGTTFLLCVPKYPALIDDYGHKPWIVGISDHTIGLDLLKEYPPVIWEKHFVLEHNDTNPDAGMFAVTPEELRSIL
jgi:sialic acid synthase SpsE